MKQWKECMIDAIDGVERHLAASAPKSARIKLNMLRQQASKIRSQKAQYPFGKELDQTIQSTSYFRAASKRYLTVKIQTGLRSAERTMKKARRFIKKHTLSN